MKKATKLIFALFLILSGILMNFSSDSINVSTLEIINNIGKITLTILIAFIVYHAFRKED